MDAAPSEAGVGDLAGPGDAGTSAALDAPGAEAEAGAALETGPLPTDGSPGETGEAGAPPHADAMPPAPLFINGCTAFVDRTEAGVARELDWQDAIDANPSRCMRIRLGQTVVWSGDFSAHPIGAHRGTLPSPIAPKTSGVERYEVVFSELGTFGYLCGDHPTMLGAIHVDP